MPGVSAKISVLDAMTPAIEHMYRGVSQLISGMYKLNEATSNSFDMSPFLEAQKSMAEAIAVQRRMENEYRQMASGAQQAQAAQNAYTGSVNTSDNAQRRHLRTVEQINTALKQIDSTAKSLITTQKQIENEYNRMRQSVAQIESVQTQLNSATVEIPVLQKQIISNQEQLVNKYQQVKECIEQAGTAQKQYNNSVIQGVNNVTVLGDRLATSIKRYVTIAASAYSGKQLIDASDTWTNNSARLGLITDNLQEQYVLQQKIYQSAKETRASYSDMVDVTAKLGLLAGDAFGSNAEVAKFTELMQKSFKLSGASTQERQSAMYQLTQAMASGKLQGDEFRSIMENAPMLANAIAEYTGVSKGELKDLSADGAITADIIKNALFSAADDIESKFSTLPMTFGDAWTNALSDATMAFSPLYEQMNNMLNSDLVQGVITELPNLFEQASLKAQEMLSVIEGAGIAAGPGLGEIANSVGYIANAIFSANGVAGSFVRTIGQIAASPATVKSIQIIGGSFITVANAINSALRAATPLLPIITQGYVAFKMYNTVYPILNNVATGVVSVVQNTNSMITALNSAKTAQAGLNAVMEANPYLSVASAIAKVIAMMVSLIGTIKAVNNAADLADNSSVEATIEASKYSREHNVDLSTAQSIVNSNNSYDEQAKALKENHERIAKARKEAEDRIKQISSPNYSPAGNYHQGNTQKYINENIEAVEESRKEQIKKLNEEVAVYDKQISDNYKAVSDLGKARKEMEQFYLDIYEQKQKSKDTLNGISDDPSDYFKDFDGSFDVDNVKNVEHINDTVDIASEDLRYMRDLAEQETINKFTSKLLQPQINVTFGEVKETADVDAITKRITDGLIESLNNSSDVVHI